MTVFKVRQDEHDEWTEINAMDAEDAVADYCDVLEGHSYFLEGYPQGDTFDVWHERGIIKVKVSTDFSPNFAAYTADVGPDPYPGGVVGYFMRYPNERGPGD